MILVVDSVNTHLLLHLNFIRLSHVYISYRICTKVDTDWLQEGYPTLPSVGMLMCMLPGKC